VWLTQAKAQFSLTAISNGRTKFYHYYLSTRPQIRCRDGGHHYLSAASGLFTARKTELLNRLSPTREQRALQIITYKEMGDRKQSQFLRHLRCLAPHLPEYFLRSIWCSRLPHTVQTALVGQPEIGLDAAARCADCIMESISLPELASVGRPADTAALLQRIEELLRRVESLSAERDHCRSNSRNHRYNQRGRPSSPTNRRLNNSSPSRLDNAAGSCWYHRRFGDRAQNCTQPCIYREQGN
jgi:hypothetical protein